MILRSSRLSLKEAGGGLSSELNIKIVSFSFFQKRLFNNASRRYKKKTSLFLPLIFFLHAPYSTFMYVFCMRFSVTTFFTCESPSNFESVLLVGGLEAPPPPPVHQSRCQEGCGGGGEGGGGGELGGHGPVGGPRLHLRAGWRKRRKIHFTNL